MDAVASTVGNMVVDQMATKPSASALYGVVGGNVYELVSQATNYKPTAPNQFSMPSTPHSGDAALFGVGMG